jgi:aspartate/tyrosine/aromatic aminotransferase
MSLFSHVPIAKPDPILNLNALYNADTNPLKVSLGVGAYRDENGKPWILPSVRKAETIISADLTKYNKEYPPQPGFPLFLKACQEFLLGDDHVILQ